MIRAAICAMMFAASVAVFSTNTASTGEDMRYFGQQEKPKPATPGTKKIDGLNNGKNMASGTATKLPGEARMATPAEAEASRKADSVRKSQEKGMGIGKPLVSKAFTDGDDSYTITVTKKK